MEQNVLEQILDGRMEPTILPFETLRKITDEFSAERIVGEGGFGTVYKGVVGNKNVAVKRIMSSKTIDEKLFRREVSSLMEVNHENIVQFLGLCSHTVETPIKNPESRGYIYAEMRERLLCFEYIGNGSLDRKITDELRGLEWDKRYKIIKGVCAGLNYLHNEKGIVHMDLKPANILLNDQMAPKITDFGLSRPTENSQTTSVNHFVSRGYTAPENIFGGSMTVMSDVYSLGVIIIEVVTGQKSIPDNNNNILRRWWHRWIRSAKSAKEVPLEYHQQVTKCIEIGRLCLKIDRLERPSISEIISKFVEMDSTIGLNNIDGQINPPAAYWKDDMLGVEPLELQFANSWHNKKEQEILSWSVELCNGTDGFIAFKTQRASPLPYSIEPNMGILKPGSKCTVEIILAQGHKAAARYSASNKQYTEEFIVRTIKVDEDFITQDIKEHMFNTHTSEHNVDEIHLTVVSEEEPQSAPPAISNLRKSSGEKQQENVDALIYCVTKNLGYSDGKPIAAFTIYKCLLHWKSFEAENTNVFKCLNKLIGSSIENKDNDNLAYWLSNTSWLLFLLQRSLKVASAPGSVSWTKSLFGRMAQGLRSAAFANMHVEATDVVRQVEAKNPALLFKQQLTGYMEKIYGIIRDNIKMELSSLISLCIQAPRTMKASMLRVSGRSSSQPESNHWHKIIQSLDVLLKVLQDKYVPPVFAQKMFTQMFSYINVQLFNSLLLRRECCTFSNAEYVKTGLADLELWCEKATTEYAASSWDQIRHIRQAIGFLVIFQKYRMSYDEIVHDICPILTVQQLYRICTHYWDDKYNTESVSPDVLHNMRVVMTEDSNNAAKFLLDDDLSLPFSVEDIIKAIHEKELPDGLATHEKELPDVKPAKELLENPAFQFLED